MSLAVAFKSPEGIVLAADSRVTITATTSVDQPLVPDSSTTPIVQVLPSYFDNATKLLSVKAQSHVGMLTYGAGVIGQAEPRTAHGYLPEFEAHLGVGGNGRLRVEEFAREVHAFYEQQWNGAGMPAAPLPPNFQPLSFLVAGFDEDESYGKIFEVSVPNTADPIEKNAGTFGIVWGGQTDFLERLLNGFDPKAVGVAKSALNLDDGQAKTLRDTWGQQLGLPIPYQFLPLQDCIDMASFLVSMTSEIQNWMISIRGVGGAVDVATITRTDGFRPVSQKRIHPWGE